MARPIKAPTERTEEGPSGPTVVLDHPAYAQIGISHVHGSTNLYGSDFEHHNFVTLTIRRSQARRDLHRDWHFGRDELITVAMSEAQYVSMIGSPNRGFGACCTITELDGRIIPGLPRRDSTQIYSDEVAQGLADTIAKLKQQRAEMEVATSKLSKAAQATVLAGITQAIREMEESLPFVVRSFNEHVETTLEMAKVEVEAYATNMITRAGLQALRGEAPLLLGSAETKK